MKKLFGLTVGDVLLMALILVSAVSLFVIPFFAESAKEAEIVMAETGEVRRISLSADGEYGVESRGVHLTVSVKDGTVSVSRSDCRDGICKNTPPISRGGQSIVCAPAGVVVRIVGEEAVVDGVSG